MRRAKLSRLSQQSQALKSNASVSSAASPMDELLGQVAHYYSKKVLTHGATPLGVDWSCVPTQEMRFVQLLKVCEFDGPITLNDIGCGYGALLAFIGKRYRRKTIDYLGVDLSAEMIAQAKKRWKKRLAERALTAFQVGSSGFRPVDYAVASGVFNVKLNQPIELWEQMIAQTLNDMHASSKRGFAVNFLAPMPPSAKHIPELYRVPPDVWRGYCEQTLSASVELVEGYGLREYTLLIRKAST